MKNEQPRKPKRAHRTIKDVVINSRLLTRAIDMTRRDVTVISRRFPGSRSQAAKLPSVREIKAIVARRALHRRCTSS